MQELCPEELAEDWWGCAGQQQQQESASDSDFDSDLDQKQKTKRSARERMAAVKAQEAVKEVRAGAVDVRSVGRSERKDCFCCF